LIIIILRLLGRECATEADERLRPVFGPVQPGMISDLNRLVVMDSIEGIGLLLAASCRHKVLRQLAQPADVLLASMVSS